MASQIANSGYQSVKKKKKKRLEKCHEKIPSIFNDIITTTVFHFLFFTVKGAKSQTENLQRNYFLL